VANDYFALTNLDILITLPGSSKEIDQKLVENRTKPGAMIHLSVDVRGC
jgi:hypothetical protein